MVTGVSRYLKSEAPGVETFEQAVDIESEVPVFEEQWNVRKYDPTTLLNVLVEATRDGWNVYRILEEDRLIVFERMVEVPNDKESEQASQTQSSETVSE
jgi:hypothetical protein